MSDRDYLAELAARIDLTPVPATEVDPDEAQATLHEGVSASGVVRAYVSGSLAFSHVQIAHLRSPDTLGADIVEAVNAAMTRAAAAFEVPGLDEAMATRIAQFDAEIDKLDESLAGLTAWIDEVHRDLDIEPDDTEADDGAHQDSDTS